MRDMKDDLRNIYNDFYGTGSDSGEEKKEPGIKQVRDKADERKKTKEPAIQEIETEVLTDTEFKVQTKMKEEESKEPEKSGMEELHELIGRKTVKHDVE